MNFLFTDDQLAIERLAGELFADFCGDERIRSLQGEGIGFDSELWRKLGETGILSLVIPERLGGSDGGAIELGLVLQQQGRFVAQVPLWRHLVGAWAIAAFGENDGLLARLASGEAIITAATEQAREIDVTAVRKGGGWVLNGRVNCVLTAGDPRYLLLCASSDAGPCFFAPDLRSPGIKRVEGEFTNREPAADFTFDNVEAPSGAKLSDRMGPQWLEARIALCTSALGLGVAEEALRRTSAYVSERKQFGRPIGSFQAVATRLADSYIQVELLRTAQWNLAWRIDSGRPHIDAARIAKYQAAETGHIVGHTAMHYHGGVGQDISYPIHRFFLWSSALEFIGGGSEDQLTRLGDSLSSENGGE